ncbi:alpha/beta hydrolase [Propionimicrobium lymphophilum]|uniref:alpha/beta hydrolase n=1 Tax=Propionimicrobium lymphophilum TaxID=33012 RepID=UPI0028896E30|nr:alpha/beta hydrolase [Propionimicrobium lymphophilum]
MSLTYKVASDIVRLLEVKKMFLKSKEEMLEYAEEEKAKKVFNIDKALKRAKRKNYYLYDRDIMGYRLLSYQKSKNPANGAVLYFFGGGMITPPDKLDFSLAERIVEQTGKDVWFLFYPLCSEDVKINKTYKVSFETYRLMTQTYKAENISVLGFSSGACLALGIFLHNNALGRPVKMPGKIISVSPGSIPDVTLNENKEIWEKVNALNHKDIIIEPTYFKTAREISKGDEDLPEYMLDGTVGDFTDFPKTYFYYGENECLYAFAGEFKKAMDKYKAPYEIIVGKGMCHCYPLLRFFKEGREAQDEIIELLKS